MEHIVIEHVVFESTVRDYMF